MADAGTRSDARVSEPSKEAPRGVHDMTAGSVRGHIVRMMLFVLTGMMIQTLYGLVDIYWVGRLGKEAVAAVALSSNLTFVCMAVTQMLSVGCVALVSQAAGKKDHREVLRLFNQAQCLSTLAGVVFLGVCLALRRTYAERLAGDTLTAELASSFLLGFVPALALQFTMVGLASALRGIGNMKPGLVAQTASVLLNMVLAPILVFGWLGAPAMGVAGAALATLLATAAAVVGLMFYLLRGGTFLRLRLADWKPDFGTWRKMIGIGLPAGAEFLLLATTMSVVYGVTRSFGAPAQAGFGIGSRLMQAGLMPAIAISFSVAAVVGQNFGSKKLDRVREALRESTKLTIGLMLLFTVVCHIAPERMVAVFNDDKAVIVAGTDYLKTISFGYVASGVVFVLAGVFQGLGNTWPSLGASTFRAIVFIVPTVLLSHRAGFEMRSIWIVSVVSSALQLGVQALFMRRELRAKAPR
jgi:putative MATE family efflux protein